MTLDYNPATDILQVDYPSMVIFHLPEIKRSPTLLVEAIRNYDVKKLLVDARNTIIELSKEENSTVTMQLASGLVNTRLQKVARLQREESEREKQAQENIDQLKLAGLLPYKLRTFTKKEEALAWLKTT